MGRFSRGSVIVMVGLIIMVMLATAAPIVAAGPNNATWIKSGWKDGPVEMPATYGEVASLPLPKGKYAVSAKLWLWNESGHVRVSDCRLTLGNSWDEVWEETHHSEHEAIALQVAGQLTQPGKAILECRDTIAQGGVQANWIKITAIRASRLRNVPLD